MKKFIFVFLILFLVQGAWANSLNQRIILSKIISTNLNTSNPGSLKSMIEEIKKEKIYSKRKDIRVFLKKIVKIYQKEKSLSKSLIKFQNQTQSISRLRKLNFKLKEFQMNLKNQNIATTESNSFVKDQIILRNIALDIMSRLEGDLEKAKFKHIQDPKSSGVFGITEEISGDCMPMISSNNKCISDLKSMDLVIRKPATVRDFLPSGILINKPELITKISSDNFGYYEVNLEPGLYSILVVQGNEEYCSNGFSKDDLACLVAVQENQKVFFTVTLDNSLW
jgi:hypothetical protein